MFGAFVLLLIFCSPLCILPNFLEYYLLCRCLLPYRIKCMTITTTKRSQKKIQQRTESPITMIFGHWFCHQRNHWNVPNHIKYCRQQTNTGKKQHYEHDIAAIIKSFHIFADFHGMFIYSMAGTKNPVRNKNTLACVFGLFGI